MATQSTHVLIVDDEPAICKALQIALTRAGYRASSALSGESAMEVIRAEHVDAQIVDLRMGDMRGDAYFELSAAMQTHLRKRTLFTTGDITEQAQQLIEACACPLLRKPFDLKDLVSWVQNLRPLSKGQTA
jgi:DNA-binding NtrC family response regulator